MFSKQQIENLLPDGRSRIQFNTKRDINEQFLKLLDYQYRSPDYEDILLQTAPAINLNHTSLKVSELLVSGIPESFWNDPELYKRKFLNPFIDSGFIEKYLVTRLMNNEQMKKEFPDYAQRAYHILHNMVFGIAKTNAASLWARKIIYYSADATIRCRDIDTECGAIFSGNLFQLGYDKDKLFSYKQTGNIKSPWIDGVVGRDSIFDYPMLDWIKSGKSFVDYIALVFWDVFTNEDYTTIDENRRDIIMAEIKKKLDGYFDVIIGNPPYNTNNEETGQVANTVYDKFCIAASELHPKYESFIIPSKWMYGKAKISNGFSQSILSNEKCSYIKLMSGTEAFPSVDTGEVCIYTIDNTGNRGKFKFCKYGEESEFDNVMEITYMDPKGNRWLDSKDSIVMKVKAKGLESLADDTKAVRLVSDIIYKVKNSTNDLLNQSNYGFKQSNTSGKTLDYSLIKTDKYTTKFYMPSVKLWKQKPNGDYEKPNTEKGSAMGYIYIDPLIIKHTNGIDFNNDYYFIINHIYNYKTKLLDYPYNGMVIGGGDYSGSRTWIIGYSCKTKEKCLNLQKFMRTKFATYLVYQNSISQNFTAETLRFVPYMDFSQEWDDDRLYKYFNLSEEEIKRIEDLFDEFRPMKLSQLQELDDEEGKEQDDVE